MGRAHKYRGGGLRWGGCTNTAAAAGSGEEGGGPVSAAYSTGLQPLPCDKDAKTEHAPSSSPWPGVERARRQHQGSNLRFLDSWQEKVGEAIRRRTVG